MIIVVNENDEESVSLGEFYAEKRGVPPENIFTVSAPRDETISWSVFIDDVFNPLQRKLIDAGWIEGTPTRQKDAEGRFNHHLTAHRMSYMVVCRGVPLRIEHDPERVTAEMEEQVQEGFRVNSAAVDSELSLLATGRHPTVAVVQNPFHRNADPDVRARRVIIKVSRLDGPRAEDARQLVESALEGERHGLRGRAYVDVLGMTSGPAAAAAATGEEWLRNIAGQLNEADWDVTARERPGTFGAEERFDAPVLYFGWYTNNVNGPFLQPGFRFVPGAIGFHIHSFSAQTLRRDDRGWAGPLVARGVAGTVGNVYEPYLQLTHQPPLFLERLLAGDNLADAAYFSLPALSWHTVLLGDPLYRPFGISHKEQLEKALEEENDPLDEYVFLREVKRLAADDRIEEAIELGRNGFLRSPGLALGLEIARLRVQDGRRDRMMETLRFVDTLQIVSPRNAGVAREVADFLARNGERERALGLYEVLASEARLSPEMRRSILRSAVDLADAVNEQSKARRWRIQLGELEQ